MIFPDTLNLKIKIRGASSLEDCLKMVATWFETQASNTNIVLEIPIYGKKKKGNLTKLIEQIDSKALIEKDASIQISDTQYILFSKNPKFEDRYLIEFNESLKGMKTEEVIEKMNYMRSICKFFLRHYIVSFVQLNRSGDGAEFFPVLPLVGSRTHLMLATKNSIEQLFEFPDSFWKNNWDSKDQYGNKFLLARAMAAASNIDFAKSITEHQWEMARAIKPNLTKYYTPAVLEEEKPLYNSGESRLEKVGYVKTEKVYEYSCLINEGDHIPGWEIFQLRSLVQDGKLADGSIVETVRVVFWEKEMALREKRPLLDVGAKVYYQGEEGDIIEIIE